MNPHEDALILCELTQEHYAEILDLWCRAELAVRPEGRDAPGAFARQLAAGHQRVIGLRAGQRLVAVAVLTHDGRKGWINRLAVDPTFRRQGLGARLITEAERWFVYDLGLEIWAALIEGDNPESQAFFAAMKYQRHVIVYVSKRTRAAA